VPWNNRIVKQTTTYTVNGEKITEDSYGIHEVFYNRKGEIINRTDRAIDVVGDTMKELRDSYEMLGEAFEQDVLVEDEIEYKESLPDPFSWKELLSNISIQFTPFNWGKSIFITKKVKSYDDDYAFQMVSGFKIGPITITW